MHGPAGLGIRPLPQRWRCPPPIRPTLSPTPPRPPSNRHLTCQTLWRALRQHLLVVSSCSWRGAVQPVQAFPPPRSRRPSRCHRLGFKMSTQKNQSCATGGNTYTGSYITAFAANHFILNEPNPIPADLVYLGVFICAFCKCICGIWQDWARGCRCGSSHVNPHYCHRYFSSIAHFSNWQIKQSFCIVPANLDIYCRFWPG